MAEATHYAVVLLEELHSFPEDDGWEPGDVIEIREASRAGGKCPFLPADKQIPGVAIVPMSLTEEEAHAMRTGIAMVYGVPSAVDGNLTELGGTVVERGTPSPLGMIPDLGELPIG